MNLSSSEDDPAIDPAIQLTHISQQIASLAEKYAKAKQENKELKR